MAHSLEEFLNKATSDTIRCTNTFELEASSGHQDVDAILDGVMMFGQNIEIPNRGVNYATVHYKGYEIPNLVPTNLTMQNEHSMTILEDIDGQNRRAFLRWMNHVINADIKGGSVFEGDRGVNEKSVIRIRLFDKDNKTVCQTYKFYNVTITSVGNLGLDYNGGDAGKFQVQFKSTYWEMEEATNGALTDQK